MMNCFLFFFFVVERQLQQTSLKEWVSRKKSSGSTEVSFFKVFITEVFGVIVKMISRA